MDQADVDLYEKHGDELIRFAAVIVGPADAEDVLAEAVLRACSSPAWLEVIDRRAYLFRAVLNQARQQRRSDRRRKLREEQVAADALVPETSGARSEVLAAMRRLTPRQRAVVFLTYWQDLEAAEVARLLHVSSRTVERQLAIARHRLEVLLR